MKTNKSIKTKIIAALVVVCVVAVAFVGLQTGSANAEYLMTVALDVNPSITMDIDTEGKILSVDANNDDAGVVLEGLDLVNMDAKDASTQIIDSMKEHGYIEDAKDSILFTVEGQTTLNETQQAIANEINVALTEASNSAVLYQVIDADEKVEELAELHNISEGKVELINEIIATDPTLTFEGLKGLSIQELSLLIVNGNRDISDTVQQSGTINTEEYIGEKAAMEAAIKLAGVEESTIVTKEVDFDLEDGKMVYEIEIETAYGEYEIDIDAKTGELIYSDYDVEDDTDDQDDDNDDNDDNDDLYDDEDDNDDDQDDLYDDVDDNDDDQDDEDDQDDDNDEDDDEDDQDDDNDEDDDEDDQDD